MRKIRKKEYHIKAYYIENNVEYVFYCKEKKIRNITDEMGMSLLLANGQSMIETNSRLDFKQNQKVRIFGETLSIDNIDQVLDNSDKNSRRGNPSYITTMIIK